MEDIVDAATRLVKSIEVEQINFAEINLAEDVSHIMAFASGKIINAADLIALCYECPGER
jgi:hypothetical protein